MKKQQKKFVKGAEMWGMRESRPRGGKRKRTREWKRGGEINWLIKGKQDENSGNFTFCETHTKQYCWI